MEVVRPKPGISHVTCHKTQQSYPDVHQFRLRRLSRLTLCWRNTPMSALRRRIGDAFRQTPSPSPSPDPQQRIPVNGEEVRLIPVSKLKGLTTRKRSKRRSGLIFGLGGLVGIFVAVFFANKQEVLNLEGLIDFNLDSILDVIPAGIVKDARDITVRSLSA
jgi:hypothetical protein